VAWGVVKSVGSTGRSTDLGAHVDDDQHPDDRADLPPIQPPPPRPTPRRAPRSGWQVAGLVVAVVLGVAGLVTVALGILFAVAMNSWASNK
jgi:hypothetical protein